MRSLLRLSLVLGTVSSLSATQMGGCGSGGGSNGEGGSGPTFATGVLDASFNGTGTATTAVGSIHDSSYAVAIQPDGKIVVAGSSNSGPQSVFAVVRYNADGTLDSGFNGTGKVTTAVGSINDYAHGVALQSDGKIVVVGYSRGAAHNVFAVVRYNPDGTPDTGFNGTGKVTTAVGSVGDYGYAVVIQVDGKIVVAGYSHTGTRDLFAVVRYNPNGTLDSGFNGTGKVTTAVGSIDDSAYAVALQSDGKIVVAGLSYYTALQNAFAVVRYNADGTLDTEFNGTGKTTTAVGAIYDSAYAVAIQPDGKIVAAGPSDDGSQNVFALVRYNANGTLDTGLNGTGKVTTLVGPSDVPEGMALQSDGKIVVAGVSSVSFAVVRYHPNGALDSGFNGTGKVTTLVGAGGAGEAVALQSDGKIVVAGYSTIGTQNVFTVARYR